MDVSRKLLAYEFTMIPALIALIKVERVTGSRHKNIKVILDRHQLCHAPVKPVGIGSCETVKQYKIHRIPVIILEIENLSHLNIIRQHKTEISMLH